MSEKEAKQGRTRQPTVDLADSYLDPAKLAQLRRGATPPLHSVEVFMVALTSMNDGP